jgi:hypothetical protein
VEQLSRSRPRRACPRRPIREASLSLEVTAGDDSAQLCRLARHSECFSVRSCPRGRRLEQIARRRDASGRRRSTVWRSPSGRRSWLPKQRIGINQLEAFPEMEVGIRSQKFEIEPPRNWSYRRPAYRRPSALRARAHSFGSSAETAPDGRRGCSIGRCAEVSRVPIPNHGHGSRPGLAGRHHVSRARCFARRPTWTSPTTDGHALSESIAGIGTSRSQQRSMGASRT